MNIIKATHQLAMDMSTLADVSKSKGFHKDALDFYMKAFDLEKKAAFMTSSIDNDPIPHYILMRSAAALAYKSGAYKEGERLIEICLSAAPPSWIIKDLQEIQTLIKNKTSSKKESNNLTFQIEGLLIKVSSEENEITIKDPVLDQNYAIIVPHNLILDIVKNHWSQKVTIDVRQTNFGVMVLKEIKAAA